MERNNPLLGLPSSLPIAFLGLKAGKQIGTLHCAGIAQYGANETATVTQQNGTNLGVQVNQYSNGASIGVAQSGTGTPNGPPIVIKQF